MEIGDRGSKVQRPMCSGPALEIAGSKVGRDGQGRDGLHRNESVCDGVEGLYLVNLFNEELGSGPKERVGK